MGPHKPTYKTPLNTVIKNKEEAMFATPEATKAYADRMWTQNPHISPDSWRILEGLTIAKVSMGSFRLDGRGTQPQALQKALLSGINLIDTSNVFMGSAAEHFIGQTLSTLFEEKSLRREEVTLISKGGYSTKEHTQNAFQLTDNLYYDLSPEALFANYTHSCVRLNVQALDGYLLHNPENLLLQLQKKHPQEEAYTLFYEALTTAFTHLEELCQQEKLQFYGITSEGVIAPQQSAGFIDLALIFEAAQKAAKKAWGRRKRPLFRIVQAPCNLIERGLIFQSNTTARTFDGTETASPLELASRMHISVLATRPLTTITPEGHIWRLIDGHKTPPIKSNATTTEPTGNPTGNTYTKNPSTKSTPTLGAPTFSTSIHAALNTLKDAENPLNPALNLTTAFQELIPQIGSATLYDHIHTNTLTPLLMQILTEATAPQTQLTPLLDAFEHMHTTLKKHISFYDGAATAPLQKKVRMAIPKADAQKPFPQIALNAVASVPGVTSVVCGIRTPEHTQDALSTLECGDFMDVDNIYSK